MGKHKKDYTEMVRRILFDELHQLSHADAAAILKKVGFVDITKGYKQQTAAAGTRKKDHQPSHIGNQTVFEYQGDKTNRFHISPHGIMAAEAMSHFRERLEAIKGKDEAEFWEKFKKPSPLEGLSARELWEDLATSPEGNSSQQRY